MKLATTKPALLSLLAAAAGLAVSVCPNTATAAPGDIYVSVPPLITRVSADGTKTNITATVLTPTGEVADQLGNLYVADRLTNSIVKIDSDGNQTTVATGLNDPQDLALDASGNLYVANTGTNSVIKIGLNGQKTTVAAGINDPQGLAIDPTDNLYVSSAGANAIVKVNPNGQKTTLVSAGLNSPAGLALDAQGNLLVADSGSNTIVKVAPDGSTSTVASGTLHTPKDVAVDGAGNILVSDSGSGQILKVSPTGITKAVTSALTAPQQITLAPGLHELLNIATRGVVQTGDNVLIGGFVVRGDANASVGQTNILVRASGPSLAAAHVSGVLADPTLALYDSNGKLIASNDNWQDSQKAQIQSTGLQPKNPKESAIYATVADGSYTAIVRGVAGTTGVALVEVYKIEQ
ncbi:MAG TPA: hypothetical protein VHW03_05245 [Chthoniobacterales bacterium]|nr:hypothetical protein [Chthoniobacterales bacterium]